MYNTSEILNITRPEKLFTGSEENVKKQFHKLAREFHPDRFMITGDPSGALAFQKINELYTETLKRIKDGTWGLDGAHRVELRDGRNYDIHSITSRPFELGHMYIGNDHVTYLVDEQFKSLFYNATKAKSFRYANEQMRHQFEPYLPQHLTIHKLKNGQRLLKIKKDPEILNLRDVLIHFNGRVPGKHTAWIVGTLCNLCCYLNYVKISHQAINPDTYFIHPRLHTGALLGGWWYAKRFGEDVEHVPAYALNLLPFKLKTQKKADPLTDCEMTRGLGREILGPDLGVPKPIREWLRSVATTDAFHDYAYWTIARDDSWRREFIDLKLDAEKLYG